MSVQNIKPESGKIGRKPGVKLANASRNVLRVDYRTKPEISMREMADFCGLTVGTIETYICYGYIKTCARVGPFRIAMDEAKRFRKEGIPKRRNPSKTMSE